MLTRRIAGGPFAPSLSDLLFKLTVRAVLQMSYDTHGEGLRRRWGAAEELPAFARWRFDRRRPPRREQDSRSHVVPPHRRHLSRGARGVQGLSQVGEQVVDHSLKGLADDHPPTQLPRSGSSSTGT